MSKERIRLSDFDPFLNNDSDGYRLAEFLQKRTGRRPLRVFNNFSHDRCSLSVRVEKLPTPPFKDSKNIHAADRSQPQGEEQSKLKIINIVNNSSATTSPHNIRRTPFTRKSANKSARLHADHLRRFSLLKACGNARRSLLKELEKTSVKEFEPLVCSTPVNESSKDVGWPRNAEVNIVNNPAASENIWAALPYKKSGSAHDLHQVQENDKQLQSLRESVDIVDKTYVVEQVILTPAPQAVNVIEIEKPNSPKIGSSVNVKSTEKLFTCPHQTSRLCCVYGLSPVNVDQSLKSAHSNENTLKILQSLQKAQSPTIVIPIHQTLNITRKPPEQIVRLDGRNNESSRNANIPNQIANVGTDSEKSDGKISDLPKVISTNMSETLIAKDIEKDFCGSDILTDDDDDKDDENDKRNKNSDNMPLDLVSEVQYVKQWRSRQKRSQMHTFQPPLQPAITEIGLKAINTRRKVLLNKAPSSPINGENYAKELKIHPARLTNYEILDLRKRKSINKDFPTTLRSPVLEPNEAELQLQVENAIQTEMQKGILPGPEIDVTFDPVPNEVEIRRDEYIFETILPAPDGFNITVPPKEKSPVISDSTCNYLEDYDDRVSFISSSNLKNSRRHTIEQTKHQSDVLKTNYLQLVKRVRKKKKVSKSKRSLYSKGCSDIEDGSISSPLQKSLRSNRKSTMQSSLWNTPPNKKPKVQVEPNHLDATDIFKTRLLPALRKKGRKCIKALIAAETSTSPSEKSAVQQVAKQHDPSPQLTDDTGIFKIPLLPAPKKKGRKRIKSVITAKTSDVTQTSSVRRSTRARTNSNSMCASLPLFKLLNKEVALETFSICEKEMKKEKKKTRQLKNNTNCSKKEFSFKTQKTFQHLGDTNASSDSSDTQRKSRGLSKPVEVHVEGDEASKNKQEHITNKTRNNGEQGDLAKSKPNMKTLQYSRIFTTPAAPVHDLNNLFAEFEYGRASANAVEKTKVTQSDSTGPSTKIKNCRVRLQRLKIYSNEQWLPKLSIVNKTHIEKVIEINPSRTGVELLSWLKGISDTGVIEGRNEIFKGMQWSAAGDLVFSDLEGIDYAFYDTEDKASLGYLRFQPFQAKKLKRAKTYQLNFIVLSGEFKIRNNEEVGTFCTGDLVIINKGSRYSIENAANVTGVLMLIKK